MANAKIKNPLKAIYVVKAKIEQNVYETKGMATVVEFQEATRLVTWSGAIKANGMNPGGTLIAERFSRKHIGAYRLVVSIFRDCGNFTFLKIDDNEAESSNGKDNTPMHLNFEVPGNEASSVQASSFFGCNDFKLAFKYNTITRKHDVEKVKEIDVVEKGSVIGAPIINDQFSVVGIVGLTEQKKICPYFIKPDLFDPWYPDTEDGPANSKNKPNQDKGQTLGKQGDKWSQELNQPMPSIKFEDFKTSLLSKRMKEIPLSFYSDICVKLNVCHPFNKDYRLFGETISLGKDEVTLLGQKGDPMDSLLQIFDTKKGNSIGKFQQIVKEMERDDVSSLIDEWINDEWEKRNIQQ